MEFCLFKYKLHRVKSYFSIEKIVIPDPSQKLPKYEEFWMNGNFSMQHLKNKTKHKKRKPVTLNEYWLKTQDFWLTRDEYLLNKIYNFMFSICRPFVRITCCSRRFILAQTLIKTAMVTVWIAALIRILSSSIVCGNGGTRLCL